MFYNVVVNFMLHAQLDFVYIFLENGNTKPV